MTESEYITLYKQQRDNAVAYCSKLLNGQYDCADDCVQIVFAELWVAIQAKDKPIANPKAYLFAALRYAVKHAKKNESRQTEIARLKCAMI